MTSGDPTLDYFEEYRAKKRELDALADEYARLKNIAEKTRIKARNLEQEISSMKRIMTIMIDDGIDPVEAKLKNDPSTLVDSIWDRNVYDDTIHELTISPSSSIYSSAIDIYKSSGAIGASGVTDTYGIISSASSLNDITLSNTILSTESRYAVNPSDKKNKNGTTYSQTI